jgi:hypothetical protein
MFATRWLTCLAGAGVSPAGIIDLARPHTPYVLEKCWRLTSNYYLIPMKFIDLAADWQRYLSVE